MLTDIDGLLNDFNRELADYESGLTLMNPFTMRQGSSESDSAIKVQYGSSISEILAHQDQCQAELEKLNDYENYLSGLHRRLDEAEELKELSDRITAIRKAIASVLQEKIMPH